MITRYPNNSIMRIGKCYGHFDEVFGIKTYQHPNLSDLVYHLIWLDTNESVEGIGYFTSPISLENWLSLNRQSLIDKKFEKLFLT